MAFSTSAAAGSECAGSGRDVAVAAAAAPDGAATTQSKEEAPGMEYCYVLGESGKIRFDRRLFIPLKEAIRSPETFEEVPEYRFIEGIDTKQPTFTSQYGKEWIRTGYLAPYYAKKLGWTIKDAFTDGNVGMVAGLRVIAFLNLDVTPSSSISTKPEQYPMSYAGFSNFLFDNLKEVYAVSESMLPLGLQELKRMTTQPPASSMPDYMIIYNPEFLPLEGLAALYIQGWRLLRRQMIVQDEIYESYTMILELDALMEPQYVKVCHTDTMVMCWIGVHRPKTILASALGLIAPPGSKMNINALTQSERVQLKALVKKLYGAGGIQAAQSGPAHTVITPSGAVIQVPKNPKEATVLDVHRHCVAHVIEKESVNAMKALKPEHQASFANKRAEWKDGVQLLMHRFPLFPHHLVTVFEQFQMWDRLSMEERLPIPRVFYMPALDDY